MNYFTENTKLIYDLFKILIEQIIFSLIPTLFLIWCKFVQLQQKTISLLKSLQILCSEKT